METEVSRTKPYAGPAPSARHVPADDTPSPRRSRARKLTTVNRSTRLGKRIVELTARGDFMRDGVGTLDDIVRHERKADQAVRALTEIEEKPRPPTLAELMASPR